MKSKLISRIVSIVIVVLMGVFYGCCVKDTFANNEGVGYEGEGHQTGVDCDISWSTVYACEYGRGDTGGAAWKWYEWPSGASKIEIPGYVNEYWPQVNLIGNDRYIRGCGDLGGYWRYAFVAVRDSDSHHYAQYLDKTTSSFKKGDQLGLSSIGSVYAQYRAEAFEGGDMYYNESLSDRSFSEVGNIYKALKKRYPKTFSLGWSGTSNLSWFCAPDPDLPLFEGTSRVLNSDVSWDDGMVNAGTGVQFSPLWKPDDTNSNDYVADKTLVLKDCDLVNGCSAIFRHYLKKDYGNGDTTYSIDRSTNDGDFVSVVKGVRNNGVNSGNLVESNNVTMYPGQKVCERFSFYSDGNYNKVSTTICAVAVATVGSDISAQIRDENSGEQYQDANWTKGLTEVYAKPGDNVELKGIYAPYYQSMYNTEISGSFTVNGFAADENVKKIGEAFDIKINPDWKNAFSVKVSSCSDPINGSVGSSSTYDGVRNYLVQGRDAGEARIKSGYAVTNCDNNAKNTPNSVGLTYSDSSGFAANVNIDSKSSNEVKIKVPYNFENSTNIQLGENIIYAGENVTVSYDVIVGKKVNGKTNGEYATPVPNASWGLEMKIGDKDWQEVQGAGDSGNLNSPIEDGGVGYLIDGRTEEKGRNVSISIPDEPAGTNICFRSWVSPSFSGTDENLSESGFDKTPATAETCTKIAKKPSFQVWGGSIYSAGKIELNKLANKTALGRTFGSWTELGIVANGTVTNLASGAGLSYANTVDAETARSFANGDGAQDVDNLGGAGSDNYCEMNTLSFANVDCKDEVGGLGGSGAGGDDRSTLISGFTNDDDNYKVVRDVRSDKISDVMEWERDENGQIVFNGISEDEKEKKTLIIDARKNTMTDDIVIDKNIVYANSGYSTLDSIPKIIIYAKNIEINCNVTRIDAVLIAEDNVNTCKEATKDNLNKDFRSTQLIINGSVIANKLSLDRTYGAATGANSIIPAEIINYDSSLYLWAHNQAKATESGKLTEAMITELAPRY